MTRSRAAAIVTAIAMAVGGLATVVAGSAAAAPLPAPHGTVAGLYVSTTPDPAAGPSTAYIYSPTSLAGAPTVRVSGAGLRTTTEPAVFSHDAAPGTWWTAPLPGGAPGIRQVRVTATSSGGAAVSGSDSYEVVGAGNTWGPRWTSAGPAKSGGLLAVRPGHPQQLYLASALRPQLFTSLDGGRNWQLQRTLPVAGGYPTALVTLPSGRLLLSVNGSNGSYVDDPTYTGKVLASDDGGTTWRDLGAPDAFVETLLTGPDDHTVVAVTNTGVEISTDSGTSWRTVPAPWARTDYSSAALVGPDLYIATFRGLYVVRDVVHATAAPALAFVPPDGRSAWVTVVTGGDDGVYAVAFYGGMFASHDGGQTWTHTYDPPGRVGLFTDLDGTLLASSGTNLLVSRDAASTWASEPEPLSGADYRAAVPAGGRIYLSAIDAGVFVSRDGAATFAYSGGTPDIDVNAVAVSHGRLIAGTTSDTTSTTLANATSAAPVPWGPPTVQTISGTTISSMAETPDGNVVYKVRNGPRIGTFTIYSTADGGSTWKQLTSFYGTPGAILVDPAVPSDVYVTAAGSTKPMIAISRDAGQTWTTAPTPAAIIALAGDPTNGRRLWLGGDDGLWSSTDAGLTTTALDPTPVSALQVLADHRLVVGGATLRYSDNGGRTLRAAATPALDLSVYSVITSPTVPFLLFAATDRRHDQAGFVKGGHGVLESVDGGQHWIEFDNGLAARDVTSLAMSPDGRQLFAGTIRGGAVTIPVLVN